MARRNRNRRRRDSNWAVMGDAETVRTFSMHRMLEALSADQVEMAELDLERFELQIEAYLANLNSSTALALGQLGLAQEAVRQLPGLSQPQQEQLLRLLNNLAAQAALPAPTPSPLQQP